MFEKLPWDSKFFGLAIARLYLDSSDNLDFIREFRQSKYQCLYLFIDKSAKRQQEECKHHGYEPIEIRLRFAKKPQRQGILKENNDIDITTGIVKSAVVRLYPIAHEISRVSRFYKDKRFRPWAYKLYEKWIQLSDNKKAHTECISAWEGNIPVGLLTLKNQSNSAVIDLFGVKRSYRRRGIGTKLLKEAEKRAYQKGAQSIKVITQKDNIASCSLYKKNGFTVQGETFVYHLWKNIG